ncbi:NCS2 family permease [Ileibacterium valens]|uniref:Guanine permease n=1 Tax=Ileibacterium valens TaxID=1862668 RepID=A0A1U7NCF0_9FIRM|nr:NCS2 family permease [Ileibacterium valens]OLU36098.1 guanine permease [Ileibacterium valens]OLU43072.1 guanine permease [Erysipelotrichaceae bacterium NYU-BL-F16]OLU43168.1 guanine permease [Erysipelotrichaceae bacterium NYU-BL-E8]
MKFLDSYFHLSEKGTNVRTEIIAGITTFLAMAYILGVNPMILSDAGMDIESVFTATALSAAVASIIMGILANYPVALAAGMGVNALFAYTICGAMGYSWEAALAAVFLSGVVFVVISITGVRKMIIDAIPVQLKLAIGAGIGFFIAFVGLKNAAIIIANESTFVGIGNFSDPTVLLSIFGILVTIACVVKKVPAAVFVGLIVTAIVGVILGVAGFENMPVLGGVFSFDFKLNAAGAFMNGFTELFANPFNAIVVIFSFLFVDFFDTAGTLVAVGTEVGLVNQKGELEGAEKALLADSIGTVFGAVIGTSTVTSFVESSSGVQVGGKTGLTAVTTGVLFLLSMLISPLILGLITNAVTAPALVVVGVMMARQMKGIDWDNMIYAVSAFVTIISMILTYSISNGIAFGFVAYTVAMISAGKAKEIHPTVWALMVIFVLYFASPYLSF